MNFLNRIITSFIIINIMYLPAFAVLDIDASVDYEIRRKYNPNKIENDLLPPLPDKLKNDVPIKSKEDFTKPYVAPVQKTQQATVLKEVQKTTSAKSYGQKLTLCRGTKFTVRNTSKISDNLAQGTKVYFRLPKPIKTKYFYLPANTRFVGIIVDSHTPQLTGNGGLIVIKVDRVVINGSTQEINAKITKSNYKKVFFNNIKGKRKYLNSICKSSQNGKRFYDKMWAKTKKLADDNWTLIVSPIPFVTGALVFGVDVIGSPIFAMFSKGGSISIPADSAFEIKLLDETTIYN